MRPKWTKAVFVDWPWSEYGKMGAPFRIYIRTKNGQWLVGAKSQARDSDGYYRDKWKRITFHPHKRPTGNPPHDIRMHIKVWR